MATRCSEKALSAGPSISERRRFPRIRLQVPLFIRGKDQDGLEFLELAKTVDISCHGARLLSNRPLQPNEMISITVPAPLPRSSEFGECGTPPFPARVRRLEFNEDVGMAAVEFLKPLL
ncbi:MAG TPA: PilZ domain-containing protein [Candidatus Acidoferrales bacterium]|nr:PilZ domain-containing protein [Candidatus Acidoferrales bacterium]